MDHFELLEGLLKEKVKHPETVSMESTIKDLGLDSLDVVDIMLAIEEKLSIHFEDEELLGLKTVKDTVDLITRKVQG